jgi:hypothetical protein
MYVALIHRVCLPLSEIPRATGTVIWQGPGMLLYRCNLHSIPGYPDKRRWIWRLCPWGWCPCSVWPGMLLYWCNLHSIPGYPDKRRWIWWLCPWGWCPCTVWPGMLLYRCNLHSIPGYPDKRLWIWWLCPWGWCPCTVWPGMLLYRCNLHSIPGYPDKRRWIWWLCPWGWCPCTVWPGMLLYWWVWQDGQPASSTARSYGMYKSILIRYVLVFFKWKMSYSNPGQQGQVVGGGALLLTSKSNLE